MTTSTAFPINEEKMTLSEEQIQFYKENGYIQIKDFLSPEEVAHLKAVMLRAVAQQKEAQAELVATMAAPEVSEEAKQAAANYGKVFDQHVNIWEHDEEMKRISFNPRWAEVARQLIGCKNVRIWHDQALIKQSGPDSRPTNWHQDTVYWPHNENGGMSIWIAIDDVDENNGCMHFIPKTRDLGRLDPVDLSTDETDLILKELKKHDENVADPECQAMPSGSVTFHDGLTFHYANANHSGKPRHAFVVIYMPDGTTYNGNKHVMTDGRGLKVDEPIADDSRFILLTDN